MIDTAYVIEEGTTRTGVPFVKVAGTGNFSVFKTFDCGQCFRFDPVPTSDGAYEVSGVALGRHVAIRQDAESCGSITLIGSDAQDWNSVWKLYLSLDTDYEEIDRKITSALDPDGCCIMARAAELSRGIRILRQDPWEALCSFIISQNNNIPRIKKIISAMCERFGETTPDGREKTFPKPEVLADAGEDEIFSLRCGFRAPYIVDAARRVASGDVDLDAIALCDNYDECAEQLKRIRGVGPKVAACTLLFGFGHLEAYPVDTWIRKVESRRFPNGLDHGRFGEYAGVAQQYLFYMERYIDAREERDIS